MKNKPKPISEAQFDEALKVHADAEKKKKLVEANRDQAASKATEKYKTELKELETDSANARAVIETYCNENKGLFEGKERSMKTAYGVIGFRTTPYGVQIPDGMKPEEIIKQLKKKKLEVLYIVTEEKLDKKAMISNRSDIKLSKALDMIGVTIAQGEAFYITLD